MFKTMWNPMFCISPRIGAFVFAILDLIITAPLAYDGVQKLVQSSFDRNAFLDGTVCIGMFFLSLLLLSGVMHRSAENIRTWLGAWTILVVMGIILYVFQISTTSDIISRIVGLGVAKGFLFLYQGWTVYAYYAQLGQGDLSLRYWPYRVGPSFMA